MAAYVSAPLWISGRPRLLASLSRPLVSSEISPIALRTTHLKRFDADVTSYLLTRRKLFYRGQSSVLQLTAFARQKNEPIRIPGLTCRSEATSVATAPKDQAQADEGRKTIELKNYKPPNFLIDSVDLRFELGEESTLVQSTLKLRRNTASADKSSSLELNGEDVVLKTVAVDGVVLSPGEYTVTATHLTIHQPPDAFTLTIDTQIKPQENTSLTGLYKTRTTFCTQCEAQGFRKITYFLDRPDVMSTFTTTIQGDKDKYPYLLSNGNPVESGDVPGTKQHFVKWVDPFRKPAYLFALVAGPLARVTSTYTTSSGRLVDLHIYVESGNEGKCAHAMESLKKSMKWDEDVFGLEYDLDLYMIVAVSDFTMGAMENKGLNVFNDRYVLANASTATDSDYDAIEAVIAHEYFHNWTGNRVTCRDWFQLSLKEGLTVFRDQQFSSDMQGKSRAVKRIADVNRLRIAQFAQDAGPMAHPVRPESYIEINNFYTATVYEKGAEVVRMLHTLIGADNFRRGMDLYFQRHDGNAVTVEDFVQAMQDASGKDLTQFRRWYSTAGTPTLLVTDHYDAQSQTYTLSLAQKLPSTPGQPSEAKKPLHIPVAAALLDSRDGSSIPLVLRGEAAAGSTTRVLELTSEAHDFVFVNVPARPVPSLLRGFSAPVLLKFTDTDKERLDADLLFRMEHDTDDFNKWDATQQLALNIILRLVAQHQNGSHLSVDARFVNAFKKTLANTQAQDETAKLFTAALLALPSEVYVGQQMDVADAAGIHAASQFLRKSLAAAAKDELLALYHACRNTASYSLDAASKARRALRNACLSYLVELSSSDKSLVQLALDQLRTADNMTEQIAALSALANADDCQHESSTALEEFYEQWQQEPLVVNKWLMIQASSRQAKTLDRVKRLMDHPSFDLKNPNKVYSLVGGFAGNQLHFHHESGDGYTFLADTVLQLDSINPQVAARMVAALSRWQKYDELRQQLMTKELRRIIAHKSLSRDVFEIASKSLASA